MKTSRSLSYVLITAVLTSSLGLMGCANDAKNGNDRAADTVGMNPDGSQLTSIDPALEQKLKAASADVDRNPDNYTITTGVASSFAGIDTWTIYKNLDTNSAVVRGYVASNDAAPDDADAGDSTNGGAATATPVVTITLARLDAQSPGAASIAGDNVTRNGNDGTWVAADILKALAADTSGADAAGDPTAAGEQPDAHSLASSTLRVQDITVGGVVISVFGIAVGIFVIFTLAPIGL